MRESYFASEVKAVHQALREGNRTSSTPVNELLNAIQENLAILLADELSPERDWRNQVATSLQVLSKAMRGMGKPAPSVEELASEMSV